MYLMVDIVSGFKQVVFFPGFVLNLHMILGRQSRRCYLVILVPSQHIVWSIQLYIRIIPSILLDYRLH